MSEKKGGEKPFTFESEAVVMENGHTAVWTDGVSIDCDHKRYCAYEFEDGEKYRITIEKLSK